MNKKLYLILILFVLFICAFAAYWPITSTEIIVNLRIPRVVQGFFTGFALALSGAVLQGVLKNPLADPFIMGVSGGSMLMLLVCKALNIPDIYFLPALGGMSAAIFSYWISKKFSSASNSGILLAGIALNAFITALITVFVIFRKDDLIYFFHFSFGNFSGLNRMEIIIFSLLSVIAFFILLMRRKNFLLLSFDEGKAKTLGIDTDRERLIFFALASLLSSFSVGLSGLVGFVGLIAPNLARIIFGVSVYRFLFFSAFLGGGLSVVSDFIARTVSAPIEIPVGAVTAFLGAPFFIYLIHSENKK